MRILKGFALGLLGLLLALSLAVFGLALTLNSTVLNPDFVVAELNRVDTASLIKDFLNGAGNDNPFPKDIRSSMVNVITKSDPLIKQQVGAAIYPVYSYVRGESQDIDLADTLGRTILQRDFVASLVNQLDLASLVKSFTEKQLNSGSVPVIGNKPLIDYINDAVTKSEPQIKQQVNSAIGPVLDYLLGKSQTLRAQISLAPIKDNLKASLKQDFLKSPPPQFASLTPAALEQSFDGFFNDITKDIPVTIEINESLLGAGLKTQIADALAQAKDALAQAREYVGYVLIAFRLSIALILLSIAGIILINRQVKASTRSIGITFVIYGALEYAGIVAIRYLALPSIANSVPERLRLFVPGLINDVLSPLQIFSLTILAVGVVLIVVSFIYKPRQQLKNV